jgi:CheY-like chemotaxis protein
MATTDQTKIKLLSAISGSRERKGIIQTFLQAVVEAENLPLAVFWMYPKAYQTGLPFAEKELVAAYSFPVLSDLGGDYINCERINDVVKGIGPHFFTHNDRFLAPLNKALPGNRFGMNDMNILCVEEYGFIQLLLNKKGISFFGGDNLVFSKELRDYMPEIIEKLKQNLMIVGELENYQKTTNTLPNDQRSAYPEPSFQNTHQSKILSTVSHEVLNPLNTIKGYTALLSEMTLDPSQAAFLGIIEEKRAQLESIVKKILNNTDLRIKEKEIREQAFDLNEVFYDLEVKFQPQAQRKGIGFNLAIDERVECWLKGPKDLFADALTFLVENAVRYSVRGQVSVSAQMLSITEDKLCLAFYVKESGGAFAKIDVNGLLNFFKPVASTAPRSHDIMGMGLSLARYYIERMGSELMFQKESEDRTFFVFKLDFTIVNSKPVVKRTGLMIENKAVTSHIKMLIVDDDHLQLEMNKNRFVDWSLFTAENGKEAIEMLKQHPDIDVVLMDINMPDMDGIATSKIIRNELKSNVPIIAYSGESRDERIDDCIAAGMNDFVTKTDDLVTPIEKALNRNDILIPATELSELGPLVGHHALVIDQFEKTRQITQKTLQDSGCKVDVANSYDGVLEKLKNAHYNFILTDFVGSDSDLFKIVRAIEALGINTKVIAYVADNSPDLHARCMYMGIKGPLLKSHASYRSLPFNIIDLLESKSLIHQAKLYNFKLMDGIDENMQSELVELFIGETTKYLDSLLTLLSAGSYDRVSIIAHTLKSSSGQFNIKAVVHDLERIEKHQKFGVSEVEVVFLVNKVVVLLNRAMQEMAEDFNLKYPID